MAEPSTRRCHPFHSRERINFPDFSPIFSRHVTPEGSKGFHWSIDHLARLKPAEIDTDPVSLIKTNGESPENDGERQGVADLFFSQRSILPSPWPTSGRQRSNLRQGFTPRLLPGSALTPVAHPKKVTFSPHPPSTAYISSDSMEVDNKESALVNVATQTCITIPFSCDLRELLGPGCLYSETDSGVRDLANSSLRRKLFGQPNRGDSGAEEDDEEEEEEEERKEEEGKDPPCTDLTPMRCVSGDCSRLSSTPLKSRTSHCPHPHTSSSSSSPPIFSAHLPTSSCHPTTSSLVLTPGVNLPQLSPIENGTRDGNCESCKRLFSSLSPNPQSRSGPHPTPSPPTCPPFSPILSHSAVVGVASCDGVRSAGSDNGGDEPLVSRTPCRVSNNSTSKTTSTPYRNGVDLVRQQQMMTGGTGTKAEPPTCTEKSASREEEGGGSGSSSEDPPQPISLGDLQTYYDDDLTSVTTCTSYFTQLATDDSHSVSDRQPLHSTVAVQNLNPQISAPDPHWGAGRLRLPSIREISRINNEPSMTGTTVDSGVAGSLDWNQPPGVSLGNSRGPENSANVGSLMEQEKDNKATSYQNSQPQLAKSEVDSGLVPSPDHTHCDHAPRKYGAVKPHEQDVGSRFQDRPFPQVSTPVTEKPPNITPSRYSNSHLHGNKFGVPLFVSQKFSTCHHPLFCGNFLPKLLPPRQTPPLTSSRKATPSRLTAFPNWFGEFVGGGGRGGHAPLFPEEVIRRKATLKAQLQFCSPVHSRSPLSNSRQPLVDTPSPVATSHPPPHPKLPPSPLPARYSKHHHHC